jgi:NADH:ubiquinone oxidoreductase subunit 6 (subunit J)
MTGETILFYLLGGATLAAALGVARSPNLVHAAFWTMPCFLGVACLFLLLQNELLFTIQLLIYAGAIPITVLFVLMLTREVMGEGRREHNRLWPLGVACGILFLAFALTFIPAVPDAQPAPGVPEELTKDVGRAFLSGYLLPFEVASLLILGSMVGAIYLARAERRPGTKEGD